MIVVEDGVRIRRELDHEVIALDGVSLSVDAGEVVALVGAPGAGKTTLLHAVAGIEPLGAGTVQTTARPWFLVQVVHVDPTLAELLDVDPIRCELAPVDTPGVVLVEEPTDFIRGDWESPLRAAALAGMTTAARAGSAVLVVTHRPDVTEVATRSVLLERGRIVGEDAAVSRFLDRAYPPPRARPDGPPSLDKVAWELGVRCAHARLFPVVDGAGRMSLVRWYDTSFEWLTPFAELCLVDASAYGQMAARRDVYLDATFGRRVPGDRDGGPGTRPGWNRELAVAHLTSGAQPLRR